MDEALVRAIPMLAEMLASGTGDAEILEIAQLTPAQWVQVQEDPRFRDEFGPRLVHAIARCHPKRF